MDKTVQQLLQQEPFSLSKTLEKASKNMVTESSAPAEMAASAHSWMPEKVCFKASDFKFSAWFQVFGSRASVGLLLQKKWASGPGGLTVVGWGGQL